MTKINTSFWVDRNVLITGHNGFKGTWLSILLSKFGANIYGFSLSNHDNSSLFRASCSLDHIKYQIEADIRDTNALSQFIDKVQPEVVFHLAAQPLVRQSYIDPLGTWSTNVQGSLNLLEAIKNLNHLCSTVMVTTDKVYENNESSLSFVESDRLGGSDPYSASKAAAEIAISSWRKSFCGQSDHQFNHLQIATARAGNVIGGGDWAKDRIVPDVIRSLIASKPLQLRYPLAVRPWQHVLESLFGYIVLAEKLHSQDEIYHGAFNFGPNLENHQTVHDLVYSIFKIWPGNLDESSTTSSPYESTYLFLDIEKSKNLLGWSPRWNFDQTIEKTVTWYKEFYRGANAYSLILRDIDAYIQC